jgi:hypothetical protein
LLTAVSRRCWSISNCVCLPFKMTAFNRPQWSVAIYCYCNVLLLQLLHNDCWTLGIQHNYCWTRGFRNIFLQYFTVVM